MDLLYSRYSNPMEFMRLYMEQGRFGEFVTNIIDMDNKRKREELEKEDENKLWQMYLHSASDKNFVDWKKEVLNKSKQQAEVPKQKASKEDVVNIINASTNLLENFSM